MTLSQLRKTKAKRTLGIDCSTKSLAFACFEDGKPIYCGEVFFNGANVFERLNDAREKTQALIDEGKLVADFVAIEAAIMVKSASTGIKLAYVYGAVMGVLMQNKSTVVEVPPITWQTGIGNPNLKPYEKAKIKADFPGKSASWYQNKGRELRKQRTLAFAKTMFPIPTNSDNVGDAVGIAYYASKNLTK